MQIQIMFGRAWNAGIRGAALLCRPLAVIPLLAVGLASAASLRVAEPTPEQTVHDNAGNLTVRIAVEDQARLPESLRIRVLIDGKLAAEGPGRQFQLSNVDRGSHEVQAQLVDADGNVVARSEPVRFHLWQASRLNRAAGR